MHDNSPRSALLMREAGLLTEAQWKAYLGEKVDDDEKSLLEIFRGDAFSPQTYRDLALFQIRLPFRQARDEEPKAIPSLEQTVDIRERELIRILEANDPGVESITELLRGQDIHFSPPQIATISEAESLGKEGYALLVKRGILTPDRLNQIVQRANHPCAEPNRVQLASAILAENHLCSLEDFLECLEKAREGEKEVGAVLRDEGKLSGDRFLERLKEGLEMPDVDLSDTEVVPEIVSLFPGSFVRRHIFVPLSRSKTALTVAMQDPLAIALCDTLSILTGLVVMPVYAPHEDLLDKVNALYPAEKGGQSSAETDSSHQPPSAVALAADSDAPVERPILTSPAPVDAPVDTLSTVQLVSSIVENAIGLRATDIHIEPQPGGVRLRYRIDGSLREIMVIPPEMRQPVTARIKVLANMNVTERRRPQDGHFSLQMDGAGFDFRVSSLPTHLGEKVVIRILDQRTVLKAMSELGMSDFQDKLLRNWISKPYGSVLVTGPTGSGKSSTLYSCLNVLNETERNIITIEDPVEYQLPGVNQVQVDNNIDLTFANGLRSSLRQDPDVIMVGEIRDLDTARIAMRAALTGHLVLSTLHTNSAVAAASALQHIGIPSFIVSNALIGIVAQRLLKTLCPHCKKKHEASAAMLEHFHVPQDEDHKWLWEAVGCERCMDIGYLGRTGCFEFFAIDEKARKLIADEAPEGDIREAAREAGMVTLLASAIEKMFAGETTSDEVVKTVLLDR